MSGLEPGYPWLPGPIGGAFFCLYLIVDIGRRKTVGWKVHDRKTAGFAAQVPARAVWAGKCLTSPPALHADNGSPMKGATMKVTMERPGVTASFSRPRVSNGNALAEALFRTCKYVPNRPSRSFATIDEARTWVQGFVRWHNTNRRSVTRT